MFASPKRSVLRVGGPVLRVGWSPQFFRVSRIHFIVRPPPVRESYALKRYNIMYTVIARMSNDPRSFTRCHCKHVAWKRKKKPYLNIYYTITPTCTAEIIIIIVTVACRSEETIYERFFPPPSLARRSAVALSLTLFWSRGKAFSIKLPMSRVVRGFIIHCAATPFPGKPRVIVV